MELSKFEVVILAGTTVSITMPVVNDDAGDPIDLSTGYTAELSIREGNYDGDEVINLTDAAGITLAAAGSVTVEMTATQSLALRDTLNKGVYTMNITETSGSVVSRAAYGEAILLDTTIQS